MRMKLQSLLFSVLIKHLQTTVLTSGLTGVCSMFLNKTNLDIPSNTGRYNYLQIKNFSSRNTGGQRTPTPHPSGHI